MPTTPNVSVTPVGDIEDTTGFQLSCDTTSVLETPVYIWIVNGTEQAEQTSQFHVVSAADITQQVAYKCRVSGDNGTSYSPDSAEVVPNGKSIWKLVYLGYKDIGVCL